MVKHALHVQELSTLFVFFGFLVFLFFVWFFGFWGFLVFLFLVCFFFTCAAEFSRWTKCSTIAMPFNRLLAEGRTSLVGA